MPSHLPFDLGAGGLRRSRPEDIDRQERTAVVLGHRFWNEGRSIQLLADEVGMGKTYVALAVATMALARVQRGRVLVLVPTPELASKWVGEIHDFNDKEFIKEAFRLASPTGIDFLADRVQQLAAPIRKREIVVARSDTSGPLTRVPTEHEFLALAAATVAADPRLERRRRAIERAFPSGGVESLVQLHRRLAALEDSEVWTVEFRAREPVPARKIWEEAVEALGHDPSSQEAKQCLGRMVRAAHTGSLPRLELLIVDEAHHWRHGSYGWKAATNVLLPKTNRGLLMTATPLHLKPADLPELFDRMDRLGRAAPSSPTCRPPSEELKAPLDGATDAAARFREAWGRLRTRPPMADDHRPHPDSPHHFAVAHRDLWTRNRELEQALGPWMIRNRRAKTHRWVLVGKELGEELPTGPRPAGHHVLHPAPGFVSPRAEVAQLALMRLTQLATDGRRPTLAAEMTGSFSAALDSANGNRARRALGAPARPYLDLLEGYVQHESALQGPIHPKLERVAALVERVWRDGEKVLVFCYRVRTAEVLYHLLEQRLGTGQDRPWASVADALRRELSTALHERNVNSLVLAGRLATTYPHLVGRVRADLPRHLAGLDIRLGRTRDPDMLATIHRTATGLLAREALPHATDDHTRAILTAVADGFAAEGGSGPAAQRAFLAEWARHPVVGASVLDRPNLFTGAPSSRIRRAGPPTPVQKLAIALAGFTERMSGDPEAQLRRRAELLEVLRHLVTSKPTLQRLLDTPHGDRDSRLERLVDAARSPFGTRPGRPTRGESLLERLASYTEYLLELGATNLDQHLAAMAPPDQARTTGARTAARRHASVQVVALAKGGRTEVRRQILEAFNTPSTPDVLVCTEIGAEGIDLHRDCRIVIHYDLSFVAAKVEQRTGRCDRLGSRSERESTSQVQHLFVGFPLLAGSYDERIFGDLLRRDQEQEALLGGDLSSTHDESGDAPDTDEDVLPAGIVDLPATLFELLRPDFSTPARPAAGPATRA